MTPRDIEKLEAIGYEVKDPRNGIWSVHGHCFDNLEDYHLASSQEEGWRDCKDDAQSPEGMKATMADKVRWLTQTRDHYFVIEWMATDMWLASVGVGERLILDTGDSPETAVDTLFWKVP